MFPPMRPALLLAPLLLALAAAPAQAVMRGSVASDPNGVRSAAVRVESSRGELCSGAVIEPLGASRILVWAQGAPGAGACLGDSGGPIAGAAGIFAVATWSRGASANSCGALSQGVLVGPQRDWIDRTLASWGTARWAP